MRQVIASANGKRELGTVWVLVSAVTAEPAAPPEAAPLSAVERARLRAAQRSAPKSSIVIADPANPTEAELAGLRPEERRQVRKLAHAARLAQSREAKRQVEEERIKKVKENLARAHQSNFDLYVRKLKSYEAEPDSLDERLRKRVVRSPKDLEDLAEMGAFKPMTLAELRGYEFAHLNNNTMSVNGQMKAYRRTAANIWKIPAHQVTGDMIGMTGAYLIAQKKASDKYRDELYNHAYNLKDWPGFGDYTRRKAEELWSVYDTKGRVIKSKLDNDCGSLHFSGVGEVIVHKSAVPIGTVLQEHWATKRWEYLNLIDGRIAAADIQRTQGTGAITQILNIVEKILQSKIEARSSAEDDYDYPFKLPWLEPHTGVDAWVDPAEVAKRQRQFILSQNGAICHNNLVPATRMRHNLSKAAFINQFLAEISMGSGISFKSIREIEDP